MNARQKAKHFKKLYEQGLPKKPYPVVYRTILPKHYRIEKTINATDISFLHGNPQLLKTHIENEIIKELRPLIWANLYSERIFYTNEYRWWLDIWFNSQEERINV